MFKGAPFGCRTMLRVRPGMTSSSGLLEWARAQAAWKAGGLRAGGLGKPFAVCRSTLQWASARLRSGQGLAEMISMVQVGWQAGSAGCSRMVQLWWCAGCWS